MTGHSDNVDAFNAYAVDFDETVGNSIVVRELRKRVYEIVRGLVPRGARILDINCGTGTDCLALSSLGYELTGVDLSPAMIDRARTKTPAGMAVRFEVLPFDRLSELESEGFDLVVSNNSGLNCVSDLRAVLADIARRLRNGGACVLVTMPPFALWESIAGLVRLDMSYMRRRKRKGSANINGHNVDVWYHGEKEVLTAAKGILKVERVTGLNVISPPPNATGFVERHPALAATLSGIDRRISGIPVLRRWGDQVLVVLRKVAAEHLRS